VTRRRGDTETRRHGDKITGLRVSASSVRIRRGSTSSLPSRSPRPRVPLSPRQSSPRRSSALITLLTDFGSSDYFVAALKGVILSVSPNTRIIDITHEIPPLDIAAAAFTLLASYNTFPARTIHLCVVDPGVGSSRRPILVTAGEQFFVGPDNGIFSYVLERESKTGVYHLNNEKYFRQPVSATFHGRDVFAPVAAALANGVKPEKLGAKIRDPVRLAPLYPDKSVEGRIRARIIHIDRFGNCITNLTKTDLTPEMIEGGVRLSMNDRTIKTLRRYFSEDGGDDAKLFAIWGSAGFLEIAATNRSAAKLLKARCGQTVVVSS
jgi:S-adenosylmethionine hydrolase